MEKFQKDDELNDELDVFRNYGFNIDDLLTMLNEDASEDNN
jgi:hypothetical protein